MKSDYGKPAREGYSKNYEKAWLRMYGIKCPLCLGSGEDIIKRKKYLCVKCKGIGYVEKDKDDTNNGKEIKK